MQKLAGRVAVVTGGASGIGRALARAFTPLQLAHGDDGHIVITASMAGVTSTPFCAPYTMSKHAVLLARGDLYLEMAAKGTAIGVSVLEGDPFRDACHARLDAIRHERNPGSAVEDLLSAPMGRPS